jgi:hypothetical protein
MFKNAVDIFTKCIAHLITWAIINCVLIGAYQIGRHWHLYTLKNQVNMREFIDSLSDQQRSDVAEAMFLYEKAEKTGK